MKLRKNTLLPLVLICFISSGTILAQTNHELSFQGILIDIQGQPICNDQFDLTIKLLHESEQEALYLFRSSFTTDEQGLYGFTIGAISRYFLDGEEFSKKVLLQMEFLPNEQTKWMKEGDDFSVTYTIHPLLMDQNLEFKVTRMEGSELVFHSEDYLFAFKDQDPFAYLLGGFLITDHPPVSPQSIEDLKQWISPDYKEDADSRGIKGGFPAGGYHRKK